ncbi:MAG: hypothetical protein WCC17_06485, partial [Candidatus Nitrosopolaris sp.]
AIKEKPFLSDFFPFSPSTHFPVIHFFVGTYTIVTSVPMLSRAMYAVIVLLSSLLKNSFIIFIPIRLFKHLFRKDNHNWWFIFNPSYIFSIVSDGCLALNLRLPSGSQLKLKQTEPQAPNVFASGLLPFSLPNRL